MNQQDNPAKDVMPPRSSGEPLVLSTRDLFRHGNTIHIEHSGQYYQLRITRGNKLILTK